MDILTKIIEAKRRRLEEAKRSHPESALRVEALTIRKSSKHHSLSNALRNGRLNVIAEFKRKSPSKGIIRNGADAKNVGRSYESAGAAAVSVLTEEDFFDGSLEDLRAVRSTISLPVLRKDFIVDEYQVYESAAAGADALLLIVAALDDETLMRLRLLAEDDLGMDALVEVHTSQELQRALACGATLIGVNNRNLKTFEVSLETSINVAREVPDYVVLISESGLNSSNDLRRLHELGYRGFLIGESLMRAESPEDALRELVGNRGIGKKGKRGTGG